MKHLILTAFCLLFLTGGFLPVAAQDKCASRTYQQVLRSKQLVSQNDYQFESWMTTKQQEKIFRTTFTPAAFRSSEEVITIPVVVHIIHNGEDYGVESNIPDEQIHEQIRILNEDFRRMNADTVLTPEQFSDVAADSRIEFKLAQRDPEGIATNGIIRKKGDQTSWTFGDDSELKNTSYWPAEDYLNIWVAPLNNNLLGYAQFPVSDLPGLENTESNRLTDGVVVTYTYFGEGYNASPTSKGRTATHEIGHFFGLRHIWGDSDCNTDDFCSDTPPSAHSNYGCPVSAESCGTEDMFQNYMDYTNDACMNLFTQQQAERMQIVMENSPRRRSLLESKGDEPPVQVAVDMGIRSISQPGLYQCNESVPAQVSLRNYGTNTVNSFTIQATAEGKTHTITKENLALETNELISITFPDLEITDKLNSEVIFLITETNGQEDLNPENNLKKAALIFQKPRLLPYLDDLEGLTVDWRIKNPDGKTQWEKVSASNQQEQNQAFLLNFFEYNDGIGETDSLISLPLDLSGAATAFLSFDLAYAPYSSHEKDSLIIYVSNDCGNSFSQANRVYANGGTNMASADATTWSFAPNGKPDWKREYIDLSAYAGSENLSIAFVGKNDWGNNLYIDNISVQTEKEPYADLMIRKVIKPSAISCETDLTPLIEVYNAGNTAIAEFSVHMRFTGSTKGEYSVDYQGEAVQPKQTVSLEMPEDIWLLKGVTQVETEIILPATVSDAYPDDNKTVQSILIDNKKDRIPARETFDAENRYNELFYPMPGQQEFWQVTAEGDKRHMYAPLYNSDKQTKSLWLISKSLDFSQAAHASMFFDLSYARNQDFEDGLALLASTDCGQTFADTVWVKSSKELATAYSEKAWNPEPGDWRKEFINLTAYAGMDNVRLAFVAINNQGNNIHLDNIEFFMSDEPELITAESNAMSLYPNPTADGNIQATFNLAQRQNLSVEIFNSTGSLAFETQLENVLNQTYELNLPHLRNGIYILQVKGQDFNAIKRIIIRQ